MRKVLTEMGVAIHIIFLLPNVLLSQQTHLDLDVISLSSIACSDPNISSEEGGSTVAHVYEESINSNGGGNTHYFSAT